MTAYPLCFEANRTGQRLYLNLISGADWQVDELPYDPETRSFYVASTAALDVPEAILFARKWRVGMIPA